jgi:membrane-bound ClpP family serine protease
MDIFIVVVLALLGLLLVLLEIFIIPGVTLAAVAGVLILAESVYYAYSHLGVVGGTATLLAELVVLVVAMVYFVKSKALDSIELKTNIQSTVASGDLLKVEEGDEGITLSRLNYMGKVKINGVIMEAKSEGEFIDDGIEIVVIKATPTQLIVKTKK